MSLSWQAVRKGEIYCAPACGRGCTLDEYDAATRGACELVVQLNDTIGGKWKPHVWENLGWHYSAISEDGYCKVHANTRGAKVTSYTAFLGPGDTGGKWSARGHTPEDAVVAVYSQAVADIAPMAGIAGLVVHVTDDADVPKHIRNALTKALEETDD